MGFDDLNAVFVNCSLHIHTATKTRRFCWMPAAVRHFSGPVRA